MHELAITKQLIDEIKLILRKENIYSGKALLEVGKLTTYSQDTIRFYFYELIKRDTFFNNKSISLDITEKPGKIKCKECLQTTLLSDRFEIMCKNCGSFKTEIQQGDKVFLKSIKANKNV